MKNNEIKKLPSNQTYEIRHLNSVMFLVTKLNEVIDKINEESCPKCNSILPNLACSECLSREIKWATKELKK